MRKFRGDLVDHVVGTLGCEREFAVDAVHAVERGIREIAAENEMLVLRGFGTFKISHRKASYTNNPNTGERMHVPASSRLGFKGASK